MTSHLDRLLFVQGGQFFCSKALPKADASIKHLVASANGGTKDVGDCFACCNALNYLQAGKSIKRKMQIVLNQHGNFLPNLIRQFNAAQIPVALERVFCSEYSGIRQ